MGSRKNESSVKQYEAPNESCADAQLTPDQTELQPESPDTSKPVRAESRIWIYLGPSIRGVVVSGRIFRGTRNEVLETLKDGIAENPQIERLIVADNELTKARSDLKAKKGIYVLYEALSKKIMGKEV